MKTPNSHALSGLTITPSDNEVYGKARMLGVAILVGLLTVGCEGASVQLEVPVISSSVPALSDDSNVEDTVASDDTLASDELVLDDDSQSESVLAEVPVLPAEGPAGSELAQPDVVEETDSPAPVQSLNIDTVAVSATNAQLSTQAQALLRGALSRGGVRIMPTGDSITHGIGGSASYRRELAGLLDTAGCVYRMVGSQSQSLRDTGYYGAHEGYSGHTADNFLTGNQTSSGNNPGIANAVNFQSPDLVLLHIGSVDLFMGQTVASTVDEIAMVIDTIHQNKPDTVVVVANVIPWFNDTQDISLPDSIRQLGNEIQELVRSSSNPLVSIADVRTGFTEDMMQSDLIHPNDDGDVHIANAIFDSYFSDSVCR